MLLFPGHCGSKLRLSRIKVAAGAALVSFALISPPTFGGTQYWDPLENSPVTGSDGSGIWDAASMNWGDGVSADGQWVAGNVAVFGATSAGTGGTVSLNADQSAGGLTFNMQAPGSAYTLGGSNSLTLADGSAITLNNTSATTNINVTVNPSTGGGFSIAGAGSLAFNSSINSSTTITMNGTGTLTLAGTADNAGLGLVANSGTVILGKINSIGTGGANVHAIGGGGLTVAGALVQLGGSGGDQIYDGANVNITSGTLDMNGMNETVAAVLVSGTGVGGNGALINSVAGTTSTLTSSSINYGGGNGFPFTAGGAGNLVLGNISNAAAGGSTITKIGTGMLTLTGSADNYAVAAIVNAGTLVLGLNSNSGAHAIGGGLTINGAGAVAQLSSATGQTGGDQIFNGATVTVTTGTFDLNGQSESINTLNGSSGGFVTNTNPGTVSTLTIVGGAAGNYAGVIQDGAGQVALVKTGGSTLTLSGSNTYTGGTTINGGTIQISTEAQLGPVPLTPTVNITLNGGELFNNNSVVTLSANRTISLGTGGGFIEAGWAPDPFTINGLVTGVGGLGVAWDGGPVVLNAVNNYQGDTTIGTTANIDYGPGSALVRLGIDNALPYGPSAGNLVFGVNPATPSASATLDLYGHNAQINGLTGSTNAVIDSTNGAGTSTLTIGNNNAGGTFAGVIKNSTGTVAVTKTGTGTQILSGVNQYAGPTTINGGTIQIGVANAVPSTGGVVLGGGTLNSGGFADNLGPLSITGGNSTLQFGAAGDSGNILQFASAAVSGGGTLAVTNWDGSTSGNGADQFFVAAAPSSTFLSSVSFINPDQTAGTFSATSVPVAGGFEIVPTAVPEPTSLGIVAIGAIGLLARRRHDRKPE